LNSNSNKTKYKDLGVHELAFVAFGGFFKKVFDPLFRGIIKRCGPTIMQSTHFLVD
jgi:hypothetical protein